MKKCFVLLIFSTLLATYFRSTIPSSEQSSGIHSQCFSPEDFSQPPTFLIEFVNVFTCPAATVPHFPER